MPTVLLRFALLKIILVVESCHCPYVSEVTQEDMCKSTDIDQQQIQQTANGEHL